MGTIREKGNKGSMGHHTGSSILSSVALVTQALSRLRASRTLSRKEL